MGNTVGSCETIYWQKKWIPIKSSLSLAKDQKEIIVGSLLGDGTMRVGKGAVNANFKVEHGLRQKEYVEWKYQHLKSLVFTEPKLSYRYRDGGEKYPKSWWFRTIRHPILTELYNQFYIGDDYRAGKKVVPSSVMKYLTPLAIAVWIMDDGCYVKKKIDISTYSFSVSDIHILQKHLRDKFNVDSKYYGDRDKGYRIFCNRDSTERLVSIIRPYIILSMKYKIGFATP